MHWPLWAIENVHGWPATWDAFSLEDVLVCTRSPRPTYYCGPQPVTELTFRSGEVRVYGDRGFVLASLVETYLSTRLLQKKEITHV